MEVITTMLDTELALWQVIIGS